ncbi:MAG: type II secretion system protein GspC [Desulfobacteraceae bacterium]|jgi:general secretion pathway protein C
MTKLYYSLFNLLALTVVIYAGVDAFYRIVRAELMQVKEEKIVMERIPHSERYKNPPLSQYRVINDRNLFGLPEKPPEALKTPEIESLEPTSLKIALLGTVAGDPESAVAVIRETNRNKDGLYRIGDSVQNAIVKMILRGKVILKVGDRDEILTMEESSSERRKGGVPSRPSEPLAEGMITLNRSELESSLQNVNTLLSQVRIRPYFRDGKAEGLAIHRIRRGSIFSKLGLRNGDIVQGVDGRSIQSPADIISVYKKLESGSPISLKIKRRGREKTLRYVFE